MLNLKVEKKFSTLDWWFKVYISILEVIINCYIFSRMVNTTVTEQAFNKAADMTYGFICCLFFFIGTVGNLISFIYFKSKRRDISNVIYMIITGNDILISITILPVGISSLSNRQPDPWFSSEYGCVAWVYIWKVAVSISIFLVICLSISRTTSLLRPFKRQKIRYFIISVITYLVLVLPLNIRVHNSYVWVYIHKVFLCHLTL